MSLGKRIRGILSYEVVVAWSVRILVVITFFLLATGVPARQDPMSPVKMNYTIIFGSPMFILLTVVLAAAIYLAIIRPSLTTGRRILVFCGWLGLVVMSALVVGVLHVFGWYPDLLKYLKMVLAVLLALPAFLPSNWRPSTIGFSLAHMGAVVFLVGAALGVLREKRFQGPIPIGEDMRIEQIPLTDGSWQKLGFGFIVRTFETDYYPVEYTLYKRNEIKEEEKPSHRHPDGMVRRKEKKQEEYSELAEYTTTKDRWYLPNGKPFSVAKLQQEDGTWAAQHIFKDGTILQKQSRSPKRYHAKLRIVIDDDNHKDFLVEVNRPAVYKGWRFYLMSPPRQGDNRGVVLLRYDPGRNWVIAGIWMLIIGVSIVCFFKKRSADAG